MSRLTGLTQFHESPAVIAAWQRALAPVLEWSTPSRRRTVLAIGALLVLVLKPLATLGSLKAQSAEIGGVSRYLVILALLAFTYACYLAAVNFARLPEAVRRRPQLTLHAVYWAVLIAIWLVAPPDTLVRSVLVGLAFTMPLVIWRCGYMLLSGQRGRAKGTSFADQLMVLFPVWGGSNTPYGKGLDYLSRSEAKTSEELARSHLAGLKLFLLAGLWYLAVELMNGAVYGDPKHQLTIALGGSGLGVPRLAGLTKGASAAPLALAWASLYAELVNQVLRHAAEGHVIIGTLRLFGFNVFRNTYKPLLAESVVAFWNRYYYYFKELMSEFFFLPTFARRLKKWNRLRLFAAVLAAAFVGNVYYHLLLREDLLMAGDAVGLWHVFGARIFYCFLLALGIFVSMVREQTRAASLSVDGPARRWLRIFGVWTFFAVICIWNVRGGGDFSERTHFFASLFGLG